MNNILLRSRHNKSSKWWRHSIALVNQSTSRPSLSQPQQHLPTTCVDYHPANQVSQSRKCHILSATPSKSYQIFHNLSPSFNHESFSTVSTVSTVSIQSRKESLKKISFHKYKPILSYIESIGLGIRPRQGKPYKHKNRSYKQNSRKKYNDDFTALSPEEEDSYFARQRRMTQSFKRTSRAKKMKHSSSQHDIDATSSAYGGKIMKVWGKYKPKNTLNDNTYDENEISFEQHSWWMPPPPFAASSDVAFEDRTKSGYQIKRLPVKVIGTSSTVVEAINDHMYTDANSVGTAKKDKRTVSVFPRSSQGLPEIAIAGRSNVGKSTLLNALLYGNQMRGINGEAPENRKFRRGITPTSMKLPKGVKAITSNKPGETRKITFYQLTSEIINSKLGEMECAFNKIGKKQHPKKKNQSQRTAKMSLLLADLPGYGFAYTSEEKAQEWRQLMTEYIVNRGKSLKRVLLLLDARHGMKNADVDFLMELQECLKDSKIKIDENTSANHKIKHRRDLPPIQIVLTKCDLVTQLDLARRVVQVREELSDILVREPSSLPVMLVSAKAGLGFNNIRKKRALGGILELQRELAALVPEPIMH